MGFGIGFNEFKVSNIYKSLILEFFGTAILVLVGCGSITNTKRTYVEIALCFGLTVTVVIQSIVHISGGHINPAVTAGMLVSGKISVIRAVLYVIVQCLGSVVGSAVLYVLLPSDRTKLGHTSIDKHLSAVQGFGVELVITFLLVFTVLSLVDPNREIKDSAPIFIGLSVTACHLWALDHTGSSMNPARSLGPAIMSNEWKDHWIYWAGPLAGGLLGGFFYHYIFSASESKGNELTDQETPTGQEASKDQKTPTDEENPEERPQEA